VLSLPELFGVTLIGRQRSGQHCAPAVIHLADGPGWPSGPYLSAFQTLPDRRFGSGGNENVAFHHGPARNDRTYADQTVAVDAAIEERHVVTDRDICRDFNGVVLAQDPGVVLNVRADTDRDAMAAAVQEMLLQSFGGVLRIFPAWPLDEATEFRTFRAEGAFLVSASWSQGQVQSLEIFSEHGARCQMYSPWPNGLAVLDGTGQLVKCTTDQFGRIGFPTQASAKYQLRPVTNR